MARRPVLRLIEGRTAPATNAAAAWEFAALGVGLTLATIALSRLPDWAHHIAAFQTLAAVAFAFFALAVLGLRRYATVPAAPLLMLAVALATRAALLPVPPSLSDDVYRYVWEGRVFSHGGDPWRQAPADPALAPFRDTHIWPRVNHPQLATIYPPGAIAGFALVSRISPTVGAMKAWITLHDFALIGVLMALCRRRGLNAAAALVYAWNPLTLIEYAGSGHHDPTAIVFLALAFLFADDHPVISGLSLAFGTLVKLAPLLALPFLIRRWNTRGRIACLAVLVPGLALFWVLTRGADSGLTAYWESWRNNGLMFEALERWTGRFAIARTIALAGIALVAAALWKWKWEAERATRTTLRVATLLSPVIHPWYLGWTLCFEPLAPSAPWLLLSLTILLNYGLWATPADPAGYHLSVAGRWIEFGAPALLAILIWSRRRWRGDFEARDSHAR
jgi:hypothetical protein